MNHRTEETMAAALKPYGWTCGPDFWKRYYSDRWVFNLANAIEDLTERLGSDEPLGIDITPDRRPQQRPPGVRP